MYTLYKCFYFIKISYRGVQCLKFCSMFIKYIYISNLICIKYSIIVQKYYLKISNETCTNITSIKKRSQLIYTNKLIISC